jgi:hypothetical protein
MHLFVYGFILLAAIGAIGTLLIIADLMTAVIIRPIFRRKTKDVRPLPKPIAIQLTYSEWLQVRHALDHHVARYEKEGSGLVHYLGNLRDKISDQLANHDRKHHPNR